MPKRSKSNTPDAVGILTRLGANPMSGVYLRPGCSDAATRELQEVARLRLGEEIPEGFLRLLKRTNGVQINGAYFKEAKNLVSENLDVLHPEVLVLGNDDMAQYVFDKRDRQFHIINMGFPDERFASFATFDEMLLAVLKEQQVG